MDLTQKLYNLKNNQFFQDSAWSLGGTVVGRGLALLAGILVARFLGKDIYGEYGIIRNTILTIGVFSTFGLGYTATKYIANFRKHAPEKIPLFVDYANKITLAFSGAMALLLFIFADVISSRWLEAEHLDTALRILSVLIIFNAITTTQIGILSGFGRFREIAKINSTVGILTFIFSAGLTYWFDLNGALIALLIVQIINCVLNFYVVKKDIPKKYAITNRDKTLKSEILVFSTPIALREALYSLSTWLLSIMIVKYSNYGQLGLYTAAIQWNAIILFIPGVLKNVILSHLSSDLNDTKSFQKILRQTVLINFISTLIPVIIIIIISNILEQFYGHTFYGLGKLISIAVFITIFSSMSGVYIQSFISLGKNWTMFYLSLLRDVGIFIFGFSFMENKIIYGAKSIIISSLLMNIFFFLVVYIVYNNFKKKHF